MVSKRMKLVLATAFLLMLSVMAMALWAQSGESQEKAGSGIIQYRLVPVPGTMTQAQLQTVLTTQGNAGWRFIGPFAVGTGPIPNQEVLMFSKP